MRAFESIETRKTSGDVYGMLVREIVHRAVEEELEKPDSKEIKNETLKPTPTPLVLREAHPLSAKALEQIKHSRNEIKDILNGNDKRNLLIVGPCSLDANKLENGQYAAIEFAKKLAELSDNPQISSKYKVILRLPPNKPRTSTGWAGLDQTDTYLAHGILTEVANLVLPIAIEANESRIATYQDMLSLAWIGARDNQSTSLRQTMAYYKDLPVLVKNSGDQPDFEAAENAIKMIQSQTEAKIVGPDNRLYDVKTIGAESVGVIYRGGRHTKDPQDFKNTIMGIKNYKHKVVVDVSHSNAVAHDVEGNKSVKGQELALENLFAILKESDIDDRVAGIMAEVYLLDGSYNMEKDQPIAGMSCTDPCMSLDRFTETLKKNYQF